MSAHGTRARYSAGCRCKRCRKANAVYMKGWRRGVVLFTPAQHGTPRKYGAGCRCEPCTIANRLAVRKWTQENRERRRAWRRAYYAENRDRLIAYKRGWTRRKRARETAG